MNLKDYLRVIIPTAIFFCLNCTLLGWKAALAVSVVLLAAGLSLRYYVKNHPASVIGKQVNLGLVGPLMSICSPQAIRRSTSPWQACGRSVLFILMMPYLLMLHLARRIWPNERW